MDSTTIQEIANQLGVAVDQVMEYLPSYANACWWSYFIPMVVVSVIFIVCVIATPICYKLYMKWDYIYDDAPLKWDGDDGYEKNKALMRKAIRLRKVYYSLIWIFGCIGAIDLIALSICLFVIPGHLIGWSTAPEMMLLMSLVN